MNPGQRALFHLWSNRPMFRSLVEPWLQSATVIANLPQQTRLEVDPRSIARRVIKSDRARSSRFFLDAAACRTQPFQDSPQYRLIEEIWRYRDRLEESPAWSRLHDQIRAGTPFTRRGGRRFALDSPEKVRAFLYGYLEIMEDMQRHGYRPDKDKDELGVAIAADGGFLKVSSGKHRTAMAQILGIPRIPVRILFVDRGWWHRRFRQLGGAPAFALEQALAAVEKESREPRDASIGVAAD